MPQAPTVLALTAQIVDRPIVAAHLARNPLPPDALPKLITDVHGLAEWR